MSPEVDSRQRAGETKRQRTHDKLVEAARDLIDDTPNPSELSMEDVAKRAGIGVSTAFNHFPTTESMVLAAYSTFFHKLHSAVENDIKRIDSEGTDTTPYDIIYDCTDALAAFCEKQPNAARALSHTISKMDARQRTEQGFTVPSNLVSPLAPLVRAFEYGQARGAVVLANTERYAAYVFHTIVDELPSE